MKKKIVSIIMCVVMVASIVVGCGGKTETTTDAPVAEENSATEEATEPELGGTIEVLVGYGDTRLEAFQGLMDKFTEETNVQVDLITPGDDDFYAQILARISADDLPDVWTSMGWSLIRYSEYSMPVNDQPWFDTMDTESLAGVMADENGTFYALAVSSAVSGLIYNKDVLEKAGVDLTELSTWEGLEGACEKIKAIGVTPIVAGGSVGGNLAGFFGSIAPAFWTDKGAVVDGAADLQNGTFDMDKYCTEMFEYFADNFVKKGYLNEDILTLDSVGAQRALGAGEAAFMFRGSDNIAVAREYYPDANLGIMPIPASQEGAKPSFRVGENDAYCVNKDTENPDACLALLAFLAKPENAEIIVRANGGLPAIDGIKLEDSYVFDEVEAAQEYCGDNVQYDNIFDRKYFPSGMWGIMGQSIGMVIDNPDDVSEAVVLVKDNYNSLYAESNK